MDEKENLSEKSDFDISTFLKFNDPKIQSLEKLNYQENQVNSIFYDSIFKLFCFKYHKVFFKAFLPSLCLT